MQFSPIKKQKPEISLIPLINVIFLLLIFFMVAGSIDNIDIMEVDLPTSSESDPKPSGASTIYMNNLGRIAVNHDFVLEKDLRTIISTLFIDDPDQKITIKTDNDVDASKLIMVMNVVEEVGGKDVLLVTKVAE
jgi:biopolymer transport protein ExbD